MRSTSRRDNVSNHSIRIVCSGKGVFNASCDGKLITTHTSHQHNLLVYNYAEIRIGEDSSEINIERRDSTGNAT